MAQRLQLRRRSCWAAWVTVGATLGGTVVGGLSVMLSVADTGGDAAQYLPMVVMVAGTLGTVGGGLAGAVCAVITRLLDRWTGGLSAAAYAAVAATITVAIAGTFGLWLTGGGAVSGPEAWRWVTLPVVVSGAVAGVAGWGLWRYAFDGGSTLGSER